MDIGPGDWVGAVREGKWGIFHKGTPYCVLSVDTDEADCEVCGGQCIGLEFVGAPQSSGWGFDGWGACSFRPIYRPKGRELINSLTKSGILDRPKLPEFAGLEP